MASSKKRRRGRKIAVAVLCLALAGGAAFAVIVHKPKSSTAIEAPSIFKTATVSTGDLTTSERIDGIVQLSSTLPVLHRIEGQTSSSVTPTATGTATTTAPTATGTANPTALASPLRIADCSATTVPTAAPAPSTAVATIDTTPVNATPVDTTADSTPAATTTTIPTTANVPATEPAITPPASAPCDTSPTTTVANSDSTPNAAGNGPAGPTIGGGGASRPAASSSTAGGTGATGSTARITQTITSIISVNTPIDQGDVLYTVDGAPVVAMDGALPEWRSLSTSSADGPDIAQLETSLVALGYDPNLKVTVDAHFDSATRTMVKAWQKGLGVEVTGTVALGSVVFLPSSTTVSAVNQAVGNSIGDGDSVLTLATPTQEVVIDVPAGDEAQVVPGLGVQIGNVQGTVSLLRSANQNGAVVVEAVIAPATAIENATNGSAVKVSLTLNNNTGVLIAPAEALVSRLDGSYAVQVQTTDGTTEFLTVELLGVSGGNVAIRGTGLSDGTVVLLPA